MTERTPEQKVADEALFKAIEAVVSAYGHLPEGAMLQDFIVQGRGLRYDGDERVTHMFTCFPDGTLDPITIMGHLAIAQAQWSHMFAESDED